MDIRDIILFIATLVNLGFASTIVFRNPRSHINISYGLSVIATALWTLGLVLFRLSSPEYAIPLARFYYISAALIATYFIFFGMHFPNKDDVKHSWWLYVFLHVPAIIISYLVFTTKFISGLSVESWGKNIVLGRAYIFYVVFWVIYMGTAFFLMLSRYKTAQPMEKLQLKFVLLGTFIAATGGSLFNLFLPLFGNYQYIWAGPYTTLIMVVFIGYAIVKHRILNIRIITTEVFSATLLAIFLIQFFRSDTLQEFALQGAILIASAFFFWLLIRAINREVESREKIAALATELSFANEELKKLRH
ncbi:MAG: Multi-sensor signal transduction histidine kinase [Parcubacteria group bacterium GW2011_GWA1_51_12]|nr:MAG: Multi-sensor signal transduction histidine kinase [Parcubacteria group bacterium GW2011_GWA1_51_12]